ncbi:hypothetical protein NW857_00405 [Synechococcus sp. H55.9]
MAVLRAKIKKIKEEKATQKLSSPPQGENPTSELCPADAAGQGKNR